MINETIKKREKEIEQGTKTEKAKARNKMRKREESKGQIKNEYDQDGK